MTWAPLLVAAAALSPAARVVAPPRCMHGRHVSPRCAQDDDVERSRVPSGFELERRDLKRKLDAAGSVFSGLTSGEGGSIADAALGALEKAAQQAAMQSPEEEP